MQKRAHEGIVKELQSHNDFKSMHGVPSSEVVNKEIIKTRMMLKAQGERAKVRLVIKHVNTWKDEYNKFYERLAQSSMTCCTFDHRVCNALFNAGAAKCQSRWCLLLAVGEVGVFLGCVLGRTRRTATLVQGRM